MMLNPFPIQWLAMLAYFILRVFVGGILVYLGYSHLKNRDSLKYALSIPWFPYSGFSIFMMYMTELVIGSMFITGFYTQYAAIIGMVLAVKILFFYKRFTSPHIPSKLFWALIFGACLSLFITGAGAFSFDLPI
ncbi:DoxX family membrane protein [bacterium]|nr:DoxX family membrane protein [bacterium]